jgi:hypothetical protein
MKWRCVLREDWSDLEYWQAEARQKIEENPDITVDELSEWFGSHNFGYFPTVPEIRREIRSVREGRP